MVAALRSVHPSASAGRGSRTPLGLRLFLLLVCLSPLLLSRVAGDGTPFPTPGRRSYYSPAPIEHATAFPTLGVVHSPTTMYFPGPFVFAHAPFAGTMFVNKSCTGMEAPGQCRRYFRLDRLASEDDELLGCNNKHNVSDAGVPYDENTMVLVIRRTPGKGCSFAEQALNAMAIGAGGIMYYGCKTTAPESCAPGLAITYSAQHITIPTPYMSYADGNRWMLNLKSASNTQPFIISFPATGPLVADEKAALQTIARNLMVGSPGAAGAATPGINDAAWNGWSSLRPWSTLVSEPDVDPCLNRIIGLVCEDGHVVSIYLPGVGGPSLHGRWDAAWGSFPRMRGLVLSQQNLQGDVPASLCDLTSLLTLDISGQADGLRPDVRQGVTSLPSCLGSLPNTQDLVYLAVSNNLLKELPPLDQPLATDFRGLRWLVADNNLLERLPVDASAFNARFLHLAQLDLSVNPTLVSRLPSFNGWPRLATLLLHHCGFYGPMASDAFDQLVSAITIDLSSNVLNGSLPSLSLAYFTSFNLANNLFEGGIPSSWAVSRLITLNLAHNRLTGPLNSLGSITSLKSLDLSDNWIGTPAGSDVGALVASMSPISIVTLRLDRNRITGGWAAGLLSAQTNLKTFSMSGNGLTELPSDMWNIAIKVWDLSYNNISGILPTGIPNEIVSLKLQGNPLLRVWPLPKWLEASDDMVTGADSRYSCQQLRNPTFSLLQVDVDAESLQFQGCVCVKGTFGQPPLCEAVPERAEVNPYWGFSSPEVGDRFLDMITLDQYNATTGTGGGSGSGGANNGTNGIDGNVSPIPDAPVEVSSLALPPGLSDDWYGQTERLTNGVSTTWFFNLADLFFDTTGANSGTNAGNSTNIRRPGAAIRLAEDAPGIVHVLDSVGNVTSVDSTTIAYDATMQPVRLIRLLLHISRDEFDKPSDNIFVYEGDPSLSGARVLAVLGTDRFTDPPPYPPPADTPASSLHLTQTAAYQSRYGAALGRLKNRTMVEVDVLTNQASLHFTSRATSGSHFFATYTYAFACTPTSKYFLDHTTNKCRPQLPTFTLSWRIRNSVYVVAALSMVWIIVHVISILVHWQAPMYRAASRAFMLLLLALLFLMSWGAILYAAVPSVSLSDADGVTVVSDDQDRALCIGRVWLSGLPLAGVLGVLLAKTNRVDSIFGSMKLLKAQRVSDGAILRSVVALLLLECVFLIVFTAMPLSKPAFAPGEGSLAGVMVAHCTFGTETGAYAWLGAQVIFFGALMLGAGYLAFRTRNLPSAFNESAHISQCLMVLIFCGMILVPLTLFVSDEPDAVVLLQGLGQALLVALLTSILFAPKLYIVLTVDMATQKDLMSTRPSSHGMPGGPPVPGAAGRTSSAKPLGSSSTAGASASRAGAGSVASRAAAGSTASRTAAPSMAQSMPRSGGSLATRGAGGSIAAGAGSPRGPTPSSVSNATGSIAPLSRPRPDLSSLPALPRRSPVAAAAVGSPNFGSSGPGGAGGRLSTANTPPQLSASRLSQATAPSPPGPRGAIPISPSMPSQLAGSSGSNGSGGGLSSRTSPVGAAARGEGEAVEMSDVGVRLTGGAGFGVPQSSTPPPPPPPSAATSAAASAAASPTSGAVDDNDADMDALSAMGMGTGGVHIPEGGREAALTISPLWLPRSGGNGLQPLQEDMGNDDEDAPPPPPPRR